MEEPRTMNISQKDEQEEVVVEAVSDGRGEIVRQEVPSMPRVLHFKHPGEKLVILKTIGTGSFARVYLVKQVRDGDGRGDAGASTSSSNNFPRYFALKVLRKARVMATQQLTYLRNEKNILTMSRAHPLIVDLYRTCTDNSHIFFLMEFVVGGELFSLLRRVSVQLPVTGEWRALQEWQARFYAAQVVLVFEYLHNYNIVYRDLKPENILIDRYGYIKLTDFGFAKQLQHNVRTHSVCGTPEYMAPEVHRHQGYGLSPDWWSLGVLIYELVSGNTPFYDEDRLRMVENILTETPRYPTYFSFPLCCLVGGLLQQDRTRRLGCMQRGAEEVKSNPWFSVTPDYWDKLLNKQIDAPYVLKEFDPSNEKTYLKYFEKYSEHEVLSSENPEFPEEFEDFNSPASADEFMELSK